MDNPYIAALLQNIKNLEILPKLNSNEVKQLRLCSNINEVNIKNLDKNLYLHNIICSLFRNNKIINL